MPAISPQLPANSAPASLFPATAWSRVAAAGGVGQPADADALEDICRRYTGPARKFLTALGCSAADAEDIVQDFLMAWARPDVMKQLSPTTGRLRSYVKQSLRHHLYNTWRKRNRAKRGGQQDHVTLEDGEHVADQAVEAEAERSYDAAWAQTLLATVLASLQASYAQRGRAELFAAIRPVLYGADDVKPYAEIGESVGMKEQQIKLEIHRLRRRFGEALRQAVAETVSDATEVDDELTHLLAIVAHAS